MLRIVTLNAASLIEPGWADRRHEQVAWIDSLDPDIVCLQEIWESPGNQNTAEWITEHTSNEWHTVFGGFPLPESFWPDSTLLFGSAILSRWPIESHELIALPVDENPAVADKPAFTMSLELLHARTNGIDVFSTHLAPPPEQAYHRVAQVQFIDDVIRQRASAGSPLPPILCGDFNAEPLSDEIRFLSSLATIDGRSTYFQDAWTVAGDGKGLTWDGRTNEIAASMHLPSKRLDYIFVGDPWGRPEGAGLVISTKLAFHEQLTGCHASDHFGLVAEIRWPSRKRS
ncbi:MAG: endonuclease/exonuclease/phosphatase family protein [Acidimicrobiales bacterium]